MSGRAPCCPAVCYVGCSRLCATSAPRLSSANELAWTAGLSSATPALARQAEHWSI